MQLSHRKVTTWSLLLVALLSTLTFITQQLPATHAQSSDYTIYLPLATNPARGCNTPANTYGRVSPTVKTDRPAAEHPDINLTIRGWSRTSAALSLVHYGGDTDDLAPQIDGMFSPKRLPRFTSAYRVNQWSWQCMCRGGPITAWDVTLLGMATSPGEPLSIPDSGYDIGGGHETLVLYATENRLTLKYTVEDNVAWGYAVHLEGVCVDPDLLRLYHTLDAAGRDQLPALRAGQPFGRAAGSEILIAIRDNGTFLDPRSQKDWWKSYPLP